MPGMKSCPKCMRTFPEDAAFCPADGSPLTHASMVPAAGTSDDPRVGTRLCGRYEVRRVVADGGMGRVYEGIDKDTNTRVAIKVLHSEVARDEVSLERFKREYEFSRQLPHDHIVQVLDFQKDPETQSWLLVMEFLDGEELRFVLKREKQIAPERLVRMLAHVALGLDGAHARQLVHRDLKPDNLFLCGTRDGDKVKILDFGSVKDKNKDAKKLTVLGTTIGSPFYMAPEQAQGLETLDARADVFALAAITYECITGKVPFSGSNGPSILLAILTKDPDPVSVAAQGSKYPTPAALDDVLEEALAKNPNIRTKSVGELATAVGRAYGLTGDHTTWATVPQHELAKTIAAELAKAPAKMEVAADPFAAPPANTTSPMAARPTGAPSQPGPMPAPSQPGPMPAHAPSQPGPPAGAYGGGHGGDDVVVAGLPQGRPAWFIPVIVGVAALVLGGGIAIIVAAVR